MHPCEDVGEPGPWVDIVEVGGRDLGVPQSRGILVRSGDNTSTVGTEGRAIHLIRMMRKRGHGGARRGVPDACGFVSQEAVTTGLPSRLNAALFTLPAWPESVATVTPVVASQMSATPSQDAVTTLGPSGLNTAIH